MATLKDLEGLWRGKEVPIPKEVPTFHQGTKYIGKSVKLVKVVCIERNLKSKTGARKKSRKFLRDKCEICNSEERLTIHHVIPLKETIIINESNCKTLCSTCHVCLEILNLELKKRIPIRKVKKILTKLREEIKERRIQFAGETLYGIHKKD